MTIGDFQVSRNTAGYGKSLSLSLSGIFSPIIVVENMQHFVKKKKQTTKYAITFNCALFWEMIHV